VERLARAGVVVAVGTGLRVRGAQLVHLDVFEPLDGARTVASSGRASIASANWCVVIIGGRLPDRSTAWGWHQGATLQPSARARPSAG
jgi:hypothetical protein